MNEFFNTYSDRACALFYSRDGQVCEAQFDTRTSRWYVIGAIDSFKAEPLY